MQGRSERLDLPFMPVWDCNPDTSTEPRRQVAVGFAFYARLGLQQAIVPVAMNRVTVGFAFYARLGLQLATFPAGGFVGVVLDLPFMPVWDCNRKI